MDLSQQHVSIYYTLRLIFIPTSVPFGDGSSYYHSYIELFKAIYI